MQRNLFPKLLALGAAALLLNGCAAAALMIAGTGAGIAGGAGVEHTLSGIAYKTFSEPLETVRTATVDSLARMDVTIVEDAATEDGWMMKGTATRRTIDIELERLTETTTRMRVVANKGDIFFKDSATSTEIITQTAQAIDDRKTRLAAAAQKPPTKAAAKPATTKPATKRGE
jgi:hypothetical protein